MVDVVVVPQEDISLVVTTCLQFQEVVPSLSTPVDPELITTNIKNLCKAGIGRLYGLRKDSTYIGALFSLTMPDFFTGVVTAQEVAWYVRVEHRRHGLKLLQRFEADCKSEGVATIAMCHLVDSMPDKMERLYTRLGYRKQDIIYRKDL